MLVTTRSKRAALKILEEIITEESTDRFKVYARDLIKAKLPIWLRWLPIGRVIDALLPEVLLAVLKELLED